MIRIMNRQRKIRVDVKKLQRFLEAMLKELGYEGFDVGVLLTTDKTIHQYNKDFRNMDKPTDILSFPYHSSLKPGERIVVNEPEDKNLGDMIISLGYVERKAPEYERSFEDHLTVLLAHGMAHLLNYDHITDEEFAVMQPVERRLLKAIGREDLMQ